MTDTLAHRPNYSSLEFNNGRPLDAAELKEIQEIALRNVREIGHLVVKNGDVMQGCFASVHVDKEDAAKASLTIESGKIFLNGIAIDVPAFQTPVDVNKLQIAAIKVTEHRVTAEQDPHLYVSESGRRGADRIHQRAQWHLVEEENTQDLISIYLIDHGALLNLNNNSGLSRLNEAIARNNRDTTGGGYLVSGLTVTAISEQQINITAGSARIEGYPVEQATNRLVTLNMDPDLETIEDETHILAPNQQYSFHRSPVVADSVSVSILRAKTLTLTRDYLANNTDIISEEALHSLTEVKQGRKVFRAGVDYQHTGKAIQWLDGGERPAANSNYQVSFQYRQRIKPEQTTATDLTLPKLPDSIQASEVLISYQFKQPRMDLIVLDREGKLHQIKGIAQLDQQDCQPLEYRGKGLALVDCLRTWDGQLAIRERKRYYPNVEQAMDNEQRLLELESMVMNLMANTRMASQLPTGYHKFFHETFIDNKHRDLHFDQKNNAEISNGLLSPEMQFLGIDDLAHPNLCLTPESKPLLKQTKISEAIKINAFKEFSPLPPEVTLIPAVDRFEVNRNQKLATQHRAEKIGTGLRIKQVTTNTHTRRWTKTSAATFMREREVKFKIRYLHPDESLEAIHFSGHTLKVAAQANANGEMSGHFTVPANVPTGKTRVQFTFPGTGTGSPDASAIYEATGTVRTELSQDTITTVTEWHDPVAQTFSLKEDHFISGGAFYLQLPQGVSPSKSVTVQLRDCVGDDRPGKKVLGHCRIRANDLQFSADVTQRPVKQHFTFNEPVFIEGNRTYALVVMTDSADYEIGIATLGQSNGRAWMREQAHEGVLFVSANAGTWTAKQGSDLAFELESAHFPGNARKTFKLGQFEVHPDCHYLTINNEFKVSNPKDKVEAFLVQKSTKIPVPLNQNIKRPDALTEGPCRLELILTGTADSTPKVMAGTQISQQQVIEQSDYVCKAIATQGKTKAIIKLECDEPNAFAQVQLYQLNTDAQGKVTETLLANPTAWDKAIRMEDGWLQRTFELTLPADQKGKLQFNIRLISQAGALPKARNFGVMLK